MNTYVPNQHLTPVERLGAPIWENIYPVRVKYVDTLSIENIKLFGLPTVGDDAIDNDMHSQPLNVIITINDMVEYFRRGITITLRTNSDAEVIYRIINDYLMAWHEQVSMGINIGDAPYEDLLLLDRFATVVYPHARTYGTGPRPSTNLFNSMASGGGAYVSRTSLFGTEQAVADGGKEEHESMAKIFARSMRDSSKSSWK